MIDRVFRWMFGKRRTDGAPDPNRIYRVLFWLVLIGIAVVVLAVWFNWVLYFVLVFVAGVLSGIFMERRRRRRILREAELDDAKGFFGRRRAKKAEKPPAAAKAGKGEPAEKAKPDQSPPAEKKA